MRIALVGLGDAGSNFHLPALAGMPSIVLAGVCDSDESRRDSAAATYRVAPFADFETMLVESRPDAGRLVATEVVRLQAGSQVNAEIPALKLSLDDGAVFTGRVEPARMAAAARVAVHRQGG